MHYEQQKAGAPHQRDARHEGAQRLGAVLAFLPTEADVQSAIVRLDEVQRRATARTLSERNLRYAVETYLRALALADECGWDQRGVSVWMCGGHVPKSYGGYRAKTTTVRIDATRPWHHPGDQIAVRTGPGGISVARVQASSRTRGAGSTVSVQIRVDATEEKRRPECWGVKPRLSDGALVWRL